MPDVEIKKIVLHAKMAEEGLKTPAIKDNSESFAKNRYGKVIDTIVFKIAPIIISIISIAISCST